MPDKEQNNGGLSGPNAFYVTMAGTVVLGLLAFGLSLLFKTPLSPQLNLSADDALIGIIATLPPVLFLWWFSNTNIPMFAEFRQSQIEFFAEIGFQFTPLRIVAMAIAAGVCEELMFRGVFQTWITGYMPVVFAILLSNIIFGLLHMRTVLYAVIAGLIGVYFGILFAATQNLLVPIISHGLYDAVALEYTRRAIINYHNSIA